MNYAHLLRERAKHAMPRPSGEETALDVANRRALMQWHQRWCERRAYPDAWGWSEREWFNQFLERQRHVAIAWLFESEALREASRRADLAARFAHVVVPFRKSDAR